MNPDLRQLEPPQFMGYSCFMGLFLKILNGEQKDTQFRVKDGYRIGRQSVEIVLKDPKVSGSHAVITSDDAGRVFVEDQESSNGIKVNNEKLPKLRLLPGVKFMLGGTEITVVDESRSVSPGVSQALLTLEKITQSKNSIKGEKKTVLFDPPVKLIFTQGPQMGETIELGFGPRYIGSDSIEFPILEQLDHHFGFEINQEGDEIFFHTSEPNVVRLNASSVSTEKISNGDTIVIGSTVIEVRLTDGN